MKKINYIVAGITLLLIVIFSSVSPRRQRATPAYNAATETTATGTVMETRDYFCPVADDQETHLVLRTEAGSMMVHTGPARFVRAQQVRFAAGEEVRVIGTRVMYQNQDSMLAREIARGSEVLILRDHQGHPLWLK